MDISSTQTIACKHGARTEKTEIFYYGIYYAGGMIYKQVGDAKGPPRHYAEYREGCGSN